MVVKPLISLPLAALLFAAACSRPEPPRPSSSSNSDASLAVTLRAYVVQLLRRYPTMSTYLGGGGFDPSLSDVDGTLRDYGPLAIDHEDQWLTATAKTIEDLAPASLSESARFDRAVALAQISFMLHQHQVRRYQERALDTYVSEPFRALDWQLQGMTATGGARYGTADEWRLVIRRVGAIPRFLATAQQQLAAGVRANRVPDARMLERDGLATAEANARYFGETLPMLAADRMSADRDALVRALGEACARASAAYLAFRDFVAATYFEGTPPKIKAAYAGDRYALGADEYNWALRNNLHVDTDVARLYDESWPIVQRTRQQMIDLAKTIGVSDVRAAFDRRSKDYPKSDTEMIAWYRDTAFRLVDYARKTGIFDVPADYKLEVTETPPPLQSSIDGAAYYPAPPFRNTGVGRFYVTPTHNDRAALQANNRAALADLAAHEGFPGHDWYYKVLTEFRDQVSPVRWLTPGAVEDSSSMWEDSMAAEGWGLYAEALMAEPQPGAPNGFYTSEERLYQLQGELYRDLRVRIDTGIHTGRLTYDDAVTLFSEVVDFLPGSCSGSATRTEVKRASCEAAERAIFRYSKWPTQAITYRLGKDQIYAMRQALARMLGNRFSPKTFHLLFIRQGTIPPGYFREALLATGGQS